MTHLFVCREYPPAAYPPGGIGTYVRYMTALLAAAGETVHVIAHRWHGAPESHEVSADGRLIVHRVALDDPSPDPWSMADPARRGLVPRALLASSYPSQAFSWHAALLAERLIESEGVDLIEAQEWEAPLYFLQLRRALNLGPTRRPPCIVHLHSSTEQIFSANGWATSVRDYLPATVLETYSIENADAVLCPSRFMADHALGRYGVPASRVHVIPYPLGDVPHLDRQGDIWSAGSICHVGRLELRKGMLELGEALGMVAPEAPALVVEFIGGDVPLRESGGPTVGHALRASVDRRTRRQFRFHGTLPRVEVFQRLAHAFAAVVPSRWDNFPYSCIEAMCTGLPIIASPNGGMREVVEDGVSGWIARDATPAGLADALRRALATSAADRERMGRAAEQSVRRACDNQTVVRQHLELGAQLRQPQPSPASRDAGVSRSHGIGVIVAGMASESDLKRWRASAQDMAAEDPSLLAVAMIDSRLRLEIRPRDDGRYSSIARAVQRLHEPLLQWFMTCPADERRAVIRDSLANPWRSARLLLARARRAGRGTAATAGGDV